MIYQREKASKASIKIIPVHKAPQQVQKLWYGIELMDFSKILLKTKVKSPKYININGRYRKYKDFY